MAAQDYTSVVQQLYVSYFGRPADYYGLQNFSAALDAMKAPTDFDALQAAVQADTAGTSALSQLVNSFNNSPESVALYGSDNSQIGIGKFVNAIYQNVLGRDADISGFNFWVDAITSGGLSKANAAAAITQAALDNTTDQGKLDALTVQHKLAIATAFTTALDTPVEIVSYSGDDAAAAARGLLKGVTDTTDVTAYQTEVTNAIDTLVGGANAGTTFSLTTGVDAIVGTEHNDIINVLSVNATTGAEQSNLGAFDSIDGGAGTDTLNIFATATANNTLTGSVKNVEKIVISGSDNIDVVAVPNAVLAAAAANARAAATAATQADATAALTQAVALQDAQAASLAQIAAAQAVANDQAAANAHAAYVSADAAATAAETNNDPNAVALRAAATQAQADATAAQATADATDATALQATAATAANTADVSQAAAAAAAATAAQTDAAALGIVATQAEAAAAAGVTNRGHVDASFFVGSDTITLVQAAATDVVNVTNQTVVLKNAAATSSTGISYASSATAGTVMLDNAAGTVTLTGSKLATATLSGSVKAVSSTVAGTVTVVDGSATDTIKTLNVALTSDATVDLAGATALTTIAAGDSTGSLELANVGNKVSAITTGSGDDVVTLSTAFTASVKTASVTTGAGDDDITVAVSGTGTYTVNAGEGDDVIHATQANLTAGNKIDGGAGNDTLMLDNGSTFATGDYSLISNVVSNVEAVEFANAVTIDASKVAQFTSFEFDAAATITKVTQTLTAHADLVASASGYTAATASADAVYGGTLNITADGAGSTITANADSAVVTVKALRAGAVDATITGDLQTSLTVNTVNTTNSSSTPTIDRLATATVTVDATHNAALKSVVLTGNGTVTIDTHAAGDGIALANIDASALGGTLATGTTTKGNITGGLIFTGNSSIAETIKLGAGHDIVTINSTVENMDTVSGFDAVKEGTTDASTTDVLVFNGITFNGAAASTAITKMTLAATDTTLDLALVHAASAAGAGIVEFQFGGDTYLFANVAGGTNTATGLDATDLLVKLVGTVDLSTAFGVAAATAV